MHSSIDASVGGFRAGEPELAIAMAGSAAGMLVIMDRGFPGVALWKAYTQAGAHLLIRARSSVARRPVQVLDDGTYLARMNLAGQKGAHPGGVLVRVIEYRVDGGEVIRLLTDLTDPAAFPAGELAALYHQRWESEVGHRWHRSSCAAFSWLCSLFLVRFVFLLWRCPAGAVVVAGRACPALA